MYFKYSGRMPMTSKTTYMTIMEYHQLCSHFIIENAFRFLHYFPMDIMTMLLITMQFLLLRHKMPLFSHIPPFIYFFTSYSNDTQQL